MFSVKERQKISEELRVLGLTRAEERVLDALLKAGTASVSSLARVSKVPRTTIHAILDRLHKRGLVRRVESSYRSLWKIVGRPKLEQRLASGLTYFDEHLSVQEIADKIGVEPSEKTGFIEFKGLDNLLKVYLWFFLNHHGEHLRCIQPLSSDAVVKKLEAENTAQINDIIKNSRVTIDIILPERAVDSYRNIGVKQPELLKTVEGRASSARLVPDPMLKFNAELILGGNTAILLDWDRKMLILVRDPEFVKMMSNLHELMAQVGRSFDHNAFVRGLVEENRKSV